MFKKNKPIFIVCIIGVILFIGQSQVYVEHDKKIEIIYSGYISNRLVFSIMGNKAMPYSIFVPHGAKFYMGSSAYKAYVRSTGKAVSIEKVK